MGILNQQLIGGGNLAAATRSPFAAPPETESAGYGGYTYAQNTEMQEVFGTTPIADRSGPNAGVLLGQGGMTQYGPPGMARMSNGGKTLLGGMAEMLKPRETGDEPEWNTEGGGAKMAQTFTTSRSLRSLKDTTGTVRAHGTVPNASGGAFAGYDANNTYGIQNWLAGGGTGTPAQEAVPAVTEDRTWIINMAGDTQTVTTTVEAAVAAVDQVESPETFGGTVTVGTGLRNLPANPNEGGSGNGES